MLIKSRPSTARCTEDMYIAYLLGDPNNATCTRLADIMGSVSDDSINRFLARERYTPEDLFADEKDKIALSGGVLSIDDTVLDKPYSDASKGKLIDYFWSGKHKRVVKGMNLITLFYTDIHGVSVPVNYRIYDKSCDKTKNDYFLEMLEEVLRWGLLPTWVTGDSWYASLGNLKRIRKLGWHFMFGVESNRTVSIHRGHYIQIPTLEDWSDNEATVYLKDYGMVTVYRHLYKKVYRYYIVSTADLDSLEGISKIDFERWHKTHWMIERFHRAIKQVCNIERFQVRRNHPIKNHVVCALKAFVKLELMRFNQLITHWYEVKRDLFVKVIRDFICGELTQEN